ncbi:hypothetical protein RZS08_48530, partial [Arthrospira platensis SPKY1]|nr:hypothetical protein [Arthrospira platensis SPKY1]
MVSEGQKAASKDRPIQTLTQDMQIVAITFDYYCTHSVSAIIIVCPNNVTPYADSTAQPAT